MSIISAERTAAFFYRYHIYSLYPTQSLIPHPKCWKVHHTTHPNNVWPRCFHPLTCILLDRYIHFYLHVDNPTLQTQDGDTSIHKSFIQIYILYRDYQLHKLHPRLHHQLGYPDIGLNLILGFQKMPWSYFGYLEDQVDVSKLWTSLLHHTSK